MSEENQTQEQVQDTGTEALKNEIERLRKHNQELLTESKKFKSTATEFQTRAEQLESEKLLEQNKYKELYEKSEAEKQMTAKQFEEFKGQIQSEKVNAVANKLTADLAGRSSKAIANYIKEFLTVDDGGAVVGRDGEAVLSIEELKSKLINDDELKHFVVSPASGGGASGNSSHAGVHKSFNEMSLEERTSLYKTDKAQYTALKEQAIKH